MSGPPPPTTDAPPGPDGAPLAGVKVVSLEQSVAGPLCSRILAELGARVLKVERPGTGDFARQWDRVVAPWSSVDLWVNASKESVALDLKDPRGRDLLLRLVEDADVLIETHTPGTAARLGLDWATLRARHPHLVYCHVSGFGQDGPYRHRRAMDLLVQGEAGLIELTGSEAEPARPAVSLADVSSGLYAAIAVLAALLRVRETGEGQEIDVSMLESTTSLLGYWAWRHWHLGERPRRWGVRHPLLVPYGVYRASDGLLNLAVSTEPMWRRFCEVVDRPELAADPAFATNDLRVAHRDRLEPLVEEILSREPREAWRVRLEGAGIPCGSVNRLEEVLTHPQLLHRGFFQTVDSEHGPLRFFAFPARLSDTPARVRSLPPRLGEHTEAVLAELGVSREAILELLRDGVAQADAAPEETDPETDQEEERP